MDDYKEVYGSQLDKPKSVEVNVDTVYLRKDIKRVTIIDESGRTTELWKYQEKQMTIKEFAMMQEEVLNADI